jgi:hypothetical protein
MFSRVLARLALVVFGSACACALMTLTVGCGEPVAAQPTAPRYVFYPGSGDHFDKAFLLDSTSGDLWMLVVNEKTSGYELAKVPYTRPRNGADR